MRDVAAGTSPALSLPSRIRPARGRVRRALDTLVTSPTAMIGLALVLVVVLIAIAAPVIAPNPPDLQLAQPLLRPGQGFWLGTDEFGRDELSRLFYGARVSLYVGVLSVAIALAFGATSGLVAGFYGGLVDTVVMRVMDILFSLPAIVLAIAITAILGPSLTNAMVAIGIVFAPRFARITRGPTLAVAGLPYIDAARTIGVRDRRIILRHVLPNVSAPLIVQITISLSSAILTEAALSFLGLGTQPPTPSWGFMLNSARQYMLVDPWVAILPGLAIALTVLGFNLLGDGLRDILDPRLRTL
ncbi:MAG TPA: ABC transporter permease [Thermomicrobiaceae bacterium]|nr:ABC transporter permease [Thermomicrobiaceae bacterium]